MKTRGKQNGGSQAQLLRTPISRMNTLGIVVSEPRNAQQKGASVGALGPAPPFTVLHFKKKVVPHTREILLSPMSFIIFSNVNIFMYLKSRNAGSLGSATQELRQVSSRNASVSSALSSPETETQTGVKERQLQKCHLELQVRNTFFSQT